MGVAGEIEVNRTQQRRVVDCRWSKRRQEEDKERLVKNGLGQRWTGRVEREQ